MACGRVRPRPSLATHESSLAKSSGCIRTPISVPLAGWGRPPLFLRYHSLTDRGQEGEVSQFPAGSKIASRAPAMALNVPVANGAAESLSKLFFCASKNPDTAARQSLRPFVPFLEVAQVLQIA